MNILIAEEDPKLARQLQRGIHRDGHHTFLARNGLHALDVLLTRSFDVTVMAVGLSGMDGLSVLRNVRRVGCETPVLLLTACDANEEIVKGMDSGADNYLSKPILLDVLLAQVRALGRRSPLHQSTILAVGDVQLDRAKREVQRGDRISALTKTEYLLLELLMRRAGHIVLRSALIEAGWSFSGDIKENTLEFFVYSLRKKLGDTCERRIIRTFRGVGYMFTQQSVKAAHKQ